MGNIQFQFSVVVARGNFLVTCYNHINIPSSHLVVKGNNAHTLIQSVHCVYQQFGTSQTKLSHNFTPQTNSSGVSAFFFYRKFVVYEKIQLGA